MFPHLLHWMLYSAWALNKGLSFLPASCERLSESLAWELRVEHHSATSPVSPTCLSTVRRPRECRSGVTLPLKIHVASPSERTTCVVTAGAGAVPWRGHPGIQQSRVVHRRHRLHLCRVRSPSGIFSTFVLGWCCTLISACVYLKCHRCVCPCPDWAAGQRCVGKWILRFVLFLQRW